MGSRLEDNTTKTAATDKSPRVTLQVGERRFTTLRDTLASESDYFAARLSDRWNDSDEDGSYFVDSDPAMFEQILRFLRSGNFPLFFDSATFTFDHAKYLSLLGEARYFGIRELVQWIEQRKYEEVVRIKKTVEIVHRVNYLLNDKLSALSENGNKVDVSTSWVTRKNYVCPRGISVHTEPSSCGRACANARGDADLEFEEELVLSATIITTTVTFNYSKLDSDSWRS
ncbi:BTB/POZ protein [Jackrogersella minutella]|nr:BTB/POZ protein [Jackrogersella minutella]